MDRIREDTIIAVEESDNEKCEDSSASELSSCSNLLAGMWSVNAVLYTEVGKGTMKSFE